MQVASVELGEEWVEGGDVEVSRSTTTSSSLYQALAGSRFPPPDEARALVTAYNEAVGHVADAEGAELVDLHTAGTDAVEDGTFGSLVADDGFHPSTEGHARIAEVFAAAL